MRKTKGPLLTPVQGKVNFAELSERSRIRLLKCKLMVYMVIQRIRFKVRRYKRK